MALAGKGGKVMVGAAQVAEVKNWSVEPGADMLDTTTQGSDWKTFIAGLKEWSGSIEGNWTVNTDTNGQKALQDAYLNGTSVSLKLYVNATNYYSGTAFIKNLSVEDSVEDLVNVSFEFQGSGALAYT